MTVSSQPVLPTTQPNSATTADPAERVLSDLTTPAVAHPSRPILPTSALYGHPAIVVFLLDHVALHQAGRNGHIEVARLLLFRGAHPHKLDERRHATLLNWAEFHRQPRMAEYLRAGLH